MSPINVNFAETENYIAPNYESTPVTDKMHAVPRFGHDDDITLLISGTEEEQMQYLFGLLAVPIIILSVFTAWSITITILKYVGRKNVGCASGSPQNPHDVWNKCTITEYLEPESTWSSSEDNTEYDDEEEDGEVESRRKKEITNVDVEQYDYEMKRIKRTIFVSQILFLISGLGALISTVFFIYYGIETMKTTMERARYSVDDVNGLLDKSVNITDGLVNSYDDTISVKNFFIDQQYRWCPNLAHAEMNPYLKRIQEETDKVADAISFLEDNDIMGEVHNVKDTLTKAQDQVMSVNESMETIDVWLARSMFIAIIQGGVIVIMMIGVTLALSKTLPKPLRFTQSYIVLPIFMLSLILSVLCSAVFVSASITGADFCYGSPDKKIITLLESFKDIINPVGLQIITYYMTGCKGASVIDFEQYTPKVVEAVDTVHNYLNLIGKVDITLLNAICGRETSGAIEMAGNLDTTLHTLAKTVDETRRLFFCSNFNGVYTDLVYDTTCKYGINGLHAIFTSQLMIAVFSMVMITLRVSWQKVENPKVT